MKTLLKNKVEAFRELYDEIFTIHNQETLIKQARNYIKQFVGVEMDQYHVEECMNRVLEKTETFNVLLTLLELERKLKVDPALSISIDSITYNQHKTIAMNICDMYGPGATLIFGHLDALAYNDPEAQGFLAKGMLALVAATVEVSKTYKIKEDYTEKNLSLLASRGVELDHMTQLVHQLQIPYTPTLTFEECETHVRGVLRKEQTYHAIDLCCKIDVGVEKGEFSEQFLEIVGKDEGLYGIDEAVNMSVSKMYGMISITNFGNLDKEKPGIIGTLDSKTEGACNTFLDDTICALVAAACARLAHNQKYSPTIKT